MDDQTTPPPPAEPTPAAAPPPADAGTSIGHRVLELRAVAAVALASLVLGGLGGAALGALSAGADDQVGPGGRGGFPGGQQLPFQQGLLPPATTPDDDVQPDAPPATQAPSGDTDV